jgi:hypothetical protein
MINLEYKIFESNNFQRNKIAQINEDISKKEDTKKYLYAKNDTLSFGQVRNFEDSYAPNDPAILNKTKFSKYLLNAKSGQAGDIASFVSGIKSGDINKFSNFTKHQIANSMQTLGSIGKVKEIAGYAIKHKLSRDDFLELLNSPSSSHSIDDIINKLTISEELTKKLSDSGNNVNIVDIFKALENTADNEEYKEAAIELEKFLSDDKNSNLEYEDIIKVIGSSDISFKDLSKYLKTLSDKEYESLITNLKDLDSKQISLSLGLLIEDNFSTKSLADIIDNNSGNKNQLTQILQALRDSSGKTNHKAIENMLDSLNSLRTTKDNELSKNSIFIKSLQKLNDKEFNLVTAMAIKSLEDINQNSNSIEIPEVVTQTVSLLENLSGGDRLNYSKILDHIDTKSLTKLYSLIISGDLESGNLSKVLLLGEKSEEHVNKLLLALENSTKEEQEVKNSKISKSVKELTDIAHHGILKDSLQGVDALINSFSSADKDVLKAALFDMDISELETKKTTDYEFLVNLKYNDMFLDKTIGVSNTDYFIDYMQKDTKFTKLGISQDAFVPKIHESIADRIKSKIDMYSKLKTEQTPKDIKSVFKAVFDKTSLTSHDERRLYGILNFEVDIKNF